MAYRSKSNTLRIFFILLLICSTNTFFYLGPWWHRSGVFNIADVGNALMWISIPLIIAFSKNRQPLWNPISPLIFFYISFVILHIFLAYANYGQSLFDGLVAIRHQFYYLSFFLFVLLLDDTKIIRKLLDILVIISIILVLLAILDYLGIKLFFHKWAGGHGIRSGIKRAYIPGMSIISFSAIWVFTKWLLDKENKIKTFGFTLMLLAAIFFRQTRMRIISVTAIISTLLIIKRRWKYLLFFLLVSLVSVGVTGITMKENIMISPFTLAYKNITQKSGTWDARLRQLKIDIKEFKRHPWIGSGVAAIRSATALGGTRLQKRMSPLSYKSDLGYAHWLKLYGIVGMIWLVLYFYFQVIMALRAQKALTGADNTLAVFTLSYLGYLAIALITLNHLMMPEHMIMFILNTAIIVRLHWNFQNRVDISNNYHPYSAN